MRPREYSLMASTPLVTVLSSLRRLNTLTQTTEVFPLSTLVRQKFLTDQTREARTLDEPVRDANPSPLLCVEL